MLITNYLAAVPEMVPFSIDASFSAAMHSTSRLAGRWQVFGSIQGDTEWLLKEDGPPPPVGSEHIHALAHPALAQICRSYGVLWRSESDLLMREFKKQLFERQVNGESFWCHVNVSDEALETSICAQVLPRWSTRSLVSLEMPTVMNWENWLQLLTWWCWERSPTRQSFHQIMEGNTHNTHTHLFTTA